jgi:hypothetical protein
METVFIQQISVKQNTNDIFDIKYIMTKRTIVDEQTPKNFLFSALEKFHFNNRASVWHFSLDLHLWCLTPSMIHLVKYQSE